MFDSSLIGIPVYHSEIKLADSLPALRNAQESGIDFSVRLLAENAYAKTAGWAIQSKNSRRPVPQAIKLRHHQIGTNITKNHQHYLKRDLSSLGGIVLA
jgi:hypothetical protein